MKHGISCLFDCLERRDRDITGLKANPLAGEASLTHDARKPSVHPAGRAKDRELGALVLCLLDIAKIHRDECLICRN
jgi:hypothetical protein